MRSGESFDFVVVGGGTAGCVLAGRLAQSGKYSVLLLEGGGADRSPWIHIPFTYYRLLRDERVCRTYLTTAQIHLAGRRIPWPRGTVLGGCSSINGLVYLRGQPQDYDGWRDSGCDGWEWSTLLPYFRRAECLMAAPSHYHGTEGPIGVTPCRAHENVSEPFIEAAQLAGLAKNENFNGATQEGVGFYQLFTRNGFRSNAASAYTRGGMASDSLKIRTHSKVIRLCMAHGRVDGVEYLDRGQIRQVRARCETLLCAGALESPHLLLRSGIGPADHLEARGVTVMHSLPGVGANLQDHLQVRLVFHCRPGTGLNERSRDLSWRLSAAWQLLAKRSGPLSAAAATVGVFARSGPDSRPDIQFHVIPFSADIPGKTLHREPAFTVSICNLRPRSRGRIELGASAAEPLQIDPNYLEQSADIEPMIEGMRLAREIGRTGALKDIVKGELECGPGGRKTSDLEYLRSTATTIFHPAGTCRMGKGEGAVVDSRLRIHGLSGLRVVDASIMPQIVSGNTCAPTIAIAERASDLISIDWK